MNQPLSFLRRCSRALPLRFFVGSRPQRKPNRGVRLELEVLERRDLMSGSPILAIACGSTTSPATGWSADQDYSGSSATYGTSNAIDTSGVTNSPPASVFQNERYGSSFTYTLPGFTAGQTYNVRLDFAEIYFNAPDQRNFNVAINGTQVLSNFDVWTQAGDQENRAVAETFQTSANSSGQIVIAFTGVVQNAKVDGIEVYDAAGTGAVQGTVYNDLTGSGKQTGTDPGLAGWTVQLLQNSSVVASTTTGSDGTYDFAGLAPGSYSVQEVLPAGYTQTASPANPVSVTAGGITTADFGAYQNTTIAGSVFTDTSGNGVRQPSEPGFPDVSVQLYTESNGQVSANPISTTTTDANGAYAFANLGPLAAGTSYVVAEATPAGSNQTTPAGSDTITLPDGRVGFVVSPSSGVALAGGAGSSVSGTGSYTFNSLVNSSITATLNYNDGQGDSGSVTAYVSPINVTFNNGADAPVNITTNCIDLLHDINVGGTYPVAVQADQASSYGNAGRMAYLTQLFGTGGSNPDEQTGLQLALWALSVPGNNPTSLPWNGSGYGNNQFSVSGLSTDATDAADIIQYADQFLGISQGQSAAGADLETTGAGQTLQLDQQVYNFGISTPPPAQPPGCT